MQPTKAGSFGRFRLDTTNECLWQGAQAIPLRPKAFAVLKHLVDHRGRLVTKQQLLDAVWPATFVTDAVLKDSIRQLREALGDDPATPRFIETAHRRGYRFIGDLTEDIPHAAPVAAHQPAIPSSLPTTSKPVLLGRDAETEMMRACLGRASSGERQVVFVTGEPGIGKTTLVNAMLEQASSIDGLRIVRGQCLEQYGSGEAYLPVLDGFSRACRAAGGDRIVERLRQHAPAWLLEMPSVLPEPEREALRRQVGGSTRERMLREMADAIEAMSGDGPLVLVLEDLHWSDYSTLDLVAYLARRRDRARLLVVGTYRPVEVILGEHPLKGVKRELQAHGLCHELPLEYLTREAIAEYLETRFPRHQLPERLSRLLHRRTEGNPLFVVNLVQYLVAEGVIAEEQGEWQLRGGLAEIESGVPDNIRQLIERQIERLSPDERTVLEGASVVGMECSSAAIGAGLAAPTGWVEEHCEALVRRHQFLSPARLVELPDGTITPRYRFSHVLYLDVPYNLLPAMRRSQMHRRIGESGEAIYRDRVGEIANELAMHFEQGLDKPRAAKYLIQAAQNATNRSAHHEAETLARRGLRVLDALPATRERAQQELTLLMTLGVSLMAIKGFAAAEVETIYARALALCTQLDALHQAFMARWLLGLFHYFRGEMRPAHEIASRLLDLANELKAPTFTIEANRAIGVTSVDLGSFTDALTYLDRACQLYDAHGQRSRPTFSGQDPKVVCDCFAARALWCLGFPDRALDRIAAALSLARELSHAESLVIANHFAAHLHQLRGDVARVQEHAAAVIALAGDHGLELWVAFGYMHRGWAAVQSGRVDEGIAALRRGLATYEATGATLWRAYFLGLMAQALAAAKRGDEARLAVADALRLVHDTDEHCSVAELHRIQGEVLLEGGHDDASAARAETCFVTALSVARQQTARSWELRAATSLAGLYRRQGKRADARRLITDAYRAIDEGAGTADVRAAAALLNEI